MCRLLFLFPNMILAFSLCFASLAAFAVSKTLMNIEKKGFIQCGVSQGLPGFSFTDKKNVMRGIDVDFCRAMAAAIFKDPNKVKFTRLSAKERFTALQSGEIDILSRNTTWTMTRDTALGLDFVGVMYYDGQGFMVRSDLGVKSAKELNGATLCMNTGTTTELNAADYFRSNKMKYKAVTKESSDEVVRAYDEKRCDAWTTDQSGLYANRIKLKDPSKHIILPEIISKEPLGPVVRQGDDAWADIARWTLFALLEAEELGVTQANVLEQAKKTTNPATARLLGKRGKMGEKLGLDQDWAVQIIKHLGNYGEIFERNLGKNSTLKIVRAQNRLWNKGGLHYPMPVR